MSKLTTNTWKQKIRKCKTTSGNMAFVNYIEGQHGIILADYVHPDALNIIATAPKIIEALERLLGFVKMSKIATEDFRLFREIEGLLQKAKGEQGGT